MKKSLEKLRTDFIAALEHGERFVEEINQPLGELEKVIYENGAVDVAGILSIHAKTASKAEAGLQSRYRDTVQKILDFMGHGTDIAAMKNAAMINRITECFDVKVPDSLRHD